MRQALSKRCKKSKTRGRKGTPAEAVLRLLALKHMLNWSYDELHRGSRDFPHRAALSALEFPLNVGAGAFLASQMPTGPASPGPANLRLGGKEAALCLPLR